MQAATQLPTAPPLSGLDLVTKTNAALQTIATNFSGADDPAALAWAFATWADTGNMLFKRRNAANTAWVVIEPLFPTMQSSLLRVATFLNSGTWTPGPGATSAEIELWGGGGGGTTAADGGDGGISTFVASGFTTLSAGGGQGTRVTESSSQGASGGDINISPPRGSYWQEVDTTTFMIPGRDAPRGGSGGAGVTSRPGSRPGGGGATIVLGPATRYGAGAGAYVYKFLATLPASAAITIGAGGSGDHPGGPGMCIIKEYGSL